MVDLEVKPYKGDGIVAQSTESEFWGAPSQWPRDPAGYVFLARAVHIIGRAKFGSAWIGDEPATPSPPPYEWLVMGDGVSRDERIRAILENRGGERYQQIKARPLLEGQKQSGPTARTVPAPSLSASPTRTRILPPESPPPPLTDDHYALLKEILDARLQETRPGALRLQQVKQIIEQACEAKWLRCAVRAIDGGPMQPLPFVAWNTDKTAARWSHCKINPIDPYGYSVSSNKHCWIFLVKEDLERFVAPPAPKEPPMKAPGFGDMHLSPYMVLMLEVVRDLKITPENQGNHAALMEEFKARWKRKRSEPFSDNDAKSMATLIREPASKGGRGTKK